MKKKNKNAYLYDAMRKGTVWKETTYQFPRMFDDPGAIKLTEPVKCVMIVAPNKGIISDEDRDFISRIDAFYNDKDGIKLAKERNKNGDVTEITYLNDGAIGIVITKNFKKLFTSEKTLNCVMALNAATVYYTMKALGKKNMTHTCIDAKVCKFLILTMRFTPEQVKAAYQLCDQRRTEARYKYCKVLYKAAKKGGYENLELSMIDEDLDDEEYPDEEKTIAVEATPAAEGING